MMNNPQHCMMGPQGPGPNPNVNQSPGGEMPPNAPPSMPITGFNQGQPMPQSGYRTNPMPGQPPVINRTSYKQ